MHPATSAGGFAFLALRVFAPFAAGYFLSYLFRSVNAVIGPELVEAVSLDASTLGLLTSAYFLTFAAAQLPLGILLDRFGPRRVEAGLLLFAAAGAMLFAVAESAATLVYGRALIGLGVSACLMAAFKANVLWFARERLPLANGMVLAAGGLGALAATAPVEAALQLTDWRGVFAALAVVTLAVAGLILAVVPERSSAALTAGLANQLREVGGILKSGVFWRLAPLPVTTQATFMAIQGLWAGPWLRDVAGLDRMAAASHLFAAAAAMTAGFLFMGVLAERLSRLGVRPLVVAVTGMTLFVLVQALLAAGWTGATLPVWVLFGFFGTSGTLSYAVLSQTFPAAMSGRVNTALNLLVFIAAFSIQWGMGAIIGAWPLRPEGYPPVAYAAAFGSMLALQGLALVWFLVSPGKAPASEPENRAAGE